MTKTATRPMTPRPTCTPAVPATLALGAGGVVEVLGVTPALEVLRVKALVSVVVEDVVSVTPVLPGGVTALVVSGGGGVPVLVPTSGVVVAIVEVSVLVAGTSGVAVAVRVSGVATVSVVDDSGGTTGVEAKVGVDGTSGVGVGVEKTVDMMTVVVGGPA